MAKRSRKFGAAHLVAVLGLALVAASVGLVGTAAASHDAPGDCDGVGYEGSGTAPDPYRVGDVEQLQCIYDNHSAVSSRLEALDSVYELVNDIDATGTVSWNDGDGFGPIGEGSTPFSGRFAGQHHTITGLSIQRDSANGVGLFGVVGSTGEVSNVSVRTVDILGESSVGVVGENRGAITNVTAVGGTIQTQSGSGTANAGGLVGDNQGTVTLSYATTDVEADGSSVGGLVGNNGGTVDRTYAAGQVTTTDSTSDVGGLVGTNGGTVGDSYWDTDASNQSTSAGGSGVTGLSTAEMTGLNVTESMDAFTFTRDWQATDSYPVLAGEDASPFYEVAITGTTSPVTEGESLEVTANVTNWGGDGTGTVTLDTSGGELDNRSLGIASGESDDSVTLVWTTSDGDAGSSELTVRSEGSSDAASVGVLVTDGGVASIDEDVVVVHRGDVAVIPLSLNDTDTATVTLGTVANTNYQVNATVQDGDGDGDVVVLFNTYAAGSEENYTVVETGDPSDRVLDVARNENSVSHSAPRVGVLDADDYQVLSVAGTVPAPDTVVSEDDVGTLSIQPRTTEDVTLWTTRSGTDVSDPAAIRERIDDGNLTQSETMASGDRLVLEMAVSGLDGPILTDLVDRGSANVTDAFLNLTASHPLLAGDVRPSNPNAEWDLWLNQTNPGSNADPKLLAVNHSTVDLIPDPENDTYWVVYDPGATDKPADGDEFVTSFTVLDDNDLATDDENVTAPWEFQTAQAELETDNYGEFTVNATSGQTFPGSSNVAPDTELTVRVRGTDQDNQFQVELDTRVRVNGSFSTTGDFSGYDLDGNYTVEVRRDDDTISPVYNSESAIPEAELETNGLGEVNVRAEPDRTFSGTSIVEPGTELTIRLTGTEEERPFVEILETQVDESGSFTATGDFSEYEPGTNYAVEVRREGETISPSYDGAVVTPPDFAVSIDDAPQSVTAGEDVTVSYTVRNVGGEVDTQDVTFGVDGIVGRTSPEVTLYGAESATGEVTFTTSFADLPGIDVAVASEDHVAMEQVSVERPDGVPSEPGPGPDPEATPEAPPTTDTVTTTPDDTVETTIEPTDTTTTTVQTDDENDSESPTTGSPPESQDDGSPTDSATGGSGPGFGFVSVLVALVGLSLLAVRRRR